MKTITTMILLLIVGEASANEQLIDVQHDSLRGVTCWILNNTGISCLPDSSLPQQATHSNESGRAFPASSALENGALQATPLPQVERFQL